MTNLFKYEIQRKWKMVLGVLVGYFLIYSGFLIKFKSEGTFSIEEFGFQLIFFNLLSSALFCGAVFGSVNNLRLEAKQASRDLYFSLPVSSFKKIGSKIIISVVELTGALVIGGYTAVKAIETLTGVKLWKPFIDEMFSVGAEELIYTLLAYLTMMIIMILGVYLSFAIFRSFFSQVKLGGLITLGIYAFLNYLFVRAFGVLIDTLSGVDITVIGRWLLLFGFMAFASIVYILISYLFEKRVSFD